MAGSSLAAVQATKASRNTALARQMVPEAQISRVPFHCSRRVSPRPRQGKNSVHPSVDVYSVPGVCWSLCRALEQVSGVSTAPSQGLQQGRRHQMPTETVRNYKYDKAPEEKGVMQGEGLMGTDTKQRGGR